MSKVLTGSKASIKVNGVKVAFAADVNINQDDQLTDIDVLDQLEVAELAETGHKVSLTINLFKVDENAAKNFGLDPDDINDVLSQPDLTIEVFNRIANKVEYVVSGAKFAGGSGSLNARGVWQGTWNFRGVRGRGL